MSFLVWIGSFAAAWWFFNLFISELKNISWGLQAHFFSKRDSSKILNILPYQFLSSFFGFGSDSQYYDSVLMADLRLFSRREFILRLALLPVSYMLIFTASLFVLQINGFFLIGSMSILLLLESRIDFFKRQWQSKLGLANSIAKSLLVFGLFLVLFEFLLRQQSLLLNAESGVSFVFLLVDGHVGSLIGIFLLSVAFSLILRLKNWSLIWALFLLFSQMSPLLGALAWIFGERVSDGIIWFLRSKDFTFLKSELRRFAIVWVLSWIGVFITMIVLKDWLASAENDYSLNANLRVMEFWVFLVIAHLAVAFMTMVWGHWTAALRPEFEPTPFVGPVSWLNDASLSPTFVESYLNQVSEKILRLEKQRSEFNEKEWAAVPRPFQKQWELEFAHLKKWEQSSKSHLTSRSQFSSVLRV